jgi:hypothetical protein
MRTIALSEATLTELYDAIAASTQGQPPPPPPGPKPAPPPPAPPAPPGYTSEQDQIIAGILYQPPPGGWPPRSANQDGRPGTLWLAIGSKGQGYYIDSAPAVAPTASDITPWPYTGIGRLIVIGDLGGISQEKRTAAQAAAMRLAGDQAAFGRYYAANYLADQTWNAGVAQVVVSGIAPETAIANLQAQGAVFVQPFNAGQLAETKTVFDGL